MKKMTSASKTERTSASSTGFAGRLAFRGDWLRRETGFAGRLASRGDWIRGETDIAGRLALRGD